MKSLLMTIRNRTYAIATNGIKATWLDSSNNGVDTRDSVPRSNIWGDVSPVGPCPIAIDALEDGRLSQHSDGL